jgi:hypothetical protein
MRSSAKTIAAFEAVRYIVLRVPGLWWLAPLVYVPVVSRLFAWVIYRRLATERSGRRLRSFPCFHARQSSSELDRPLKPNARSR